jgi:hypothetical protein
MCNSDTQDAAHVQVLDQNRTVVIEWVLTFPPGAVVLAGLLKMTKGSDSLVMSHAVFDCGQRG